MKKVPFNNTKAITLTVGFFASFLFPICGYSATYVSEALGVIDSNNQPVNQLFGSAGNPGIGPVPVDQSLILGPPDNNEWVSFALGQEATFGFGNFVAVNSVFVAVLSNGANETGSLYGRIQATDPWVFLGSLSEPNVGALGSSPNIEIFNLAGSGLSQVNQVKIVSTSSAGSFPGLDIQGIGANIVAPIPIPAAVWLFASTLAGLGFFGKWRSKHTPA
jgi:hypothetical protein